MITIIFGAPRKGKTALMTRLAIERMKQGRGDIKECVKLLKQMNSTGFNFTLPEKHLVFADYFIKADRMGVKRCNEVNGYYLGLPNDEHLTMFLPPYSQIYLDEAQKYYNSREKGLADFVSQYYALHGHNNFNVTLTCQRPQLIDANVRELAECFIEVLDLKHKIKHGKIIKSIWKCRVFNSIFEVEQYLKSGKIKDWGDIVEYTFDGNIFKHYNSFNHMATHFRDRYTKDFDIIPATAVGVSLRSIVEYNQKHDYTVPDTYYKKGSKSKK